MNDEIRDLLYRSLDEELGYEEQHRLEEALQQLEALRQEKACMLALREAVSACAAESFKPFFTERVMQQLAPEPFLESLFYVFRRVALAGAAAVIALIVFNIAGSDKVSATAALGVPELTIEEVMESPFESVMEVLS